MRSGKWLIAFVAVLVFATTAPPNNLHAADKNAPIYNKSSKGGKNGPLSFSEEGKRSASKSNSDELPFSERMARKKKELHERIASAAAERAAETKALVDQINAEAGIRSMQPQQRGADGGPQDGRSKKTYVYNPDGKKKEDKPSIVVTPGSNAGQDDGGAFNVFKFNKKK